MSSSAAARLCEAFDYPDSLRVLLDQVVAAASEHLGSVRGIVLSPSISTGDFLWRRCPDGELLLSDVDGFVFADATATGRQAFARELDRLAKEHGGPLFKLDFSVTPSPALKRLPASFQMAETAIAGFELFGGELLTRFPRDFDPRVSRQAFLLNFYKPLRFQQPGPDDSPDSPASGYAQSAARLLLDIPLLATSERGECRAGHGARGRWFLEQRPEPLGADPLLNEAVELALRARESPPGDRDPLEKIVKPAIFRTVELLDGNGPVPEDPDPALVARLAAWLPPRTARRAAGELRCLVRRPTSPAADLRWWAARKEAIGGAALLGLLAYAHAGSSGRPPEGIGRRLTDWTRRPAPVGEGARWLRSACEAYGTGLIELYPAMTPAPPSSTS